MCTVLDAEHLQQLNYVRSKTWATFLDNTNKTGDCVEEVDFAIETFSNYDENDSNDDLASMEDGECDELSIDSDILRKVTNATRFSILLNNNTLSKPADATGFNDENHELLDAFNQTLPIINEHNRLLKESGFDRILDTFDRNKIEDKVGSWLNRHNTLYGGDATVVSPERNDWHNQKSCYDINLEHQYKTKPAYQNYHRQKDESDDSLQSGETARYIRSSRASAMKSASSSTTTMIKTYRMVKSKREALREKYACEQDDDETHLKALRHRRRIAATELEYHHNHYEHGRSLRSQKHQMYATPSTCSQKRKVLRKRTISNSCSNLDSSSDSDSYYYDNDDCIHRKKLPCCSKHHYAPVHHKYGTPATVRHSHRSAMKMPSSRSNRIYYYSHSLSRSLSSSSSSTSLTATRERRRLNKRNCISNNDNRPCMRESECRCCDERKLCQDYKHIADTSTEEWFVENCHSPKKHLKTLSNSQPKSHRSRSTSAEHLVPINEKDKDISKKTKQKQIKSSDKAANPEETKKKQPKKKEKTKVSKTKKNPNVSSTIPENSFEMELQMAIEASKKLYELEQQMKLKKSEIETKKIQEPKSEKPLKKFPKLKVDDNDLTMSDNEQTMKEIQTNRKRPKTKSNPIICKDSEIKEKIPKLVDYHKDTTAIAQNLSGEEIFVKPRPPKPLLKASTKTKDSTITSTEETFFVSKNQVICNSTARPLDDQAYNRQFADTIFHKDYSQKPEEVINNSTTKTDDNHSYDPQFSDSMLHQKINDTDGVRKEVQTIKSETQNTEYNKKLAICDVETKDRCGTEEKHGTGKVRNLSKIEDYNDSTKLETEQAFDKDTSVKLQSKSVKKSSKTENSTITNTDETFLASTHNQVICNSTAKPDDTQAYSRQFSNSMCHKDKTLKPENINESKTQGQKNETKSNVFKTKEVKERKHKTKSYKKTTDCADASSKKTATSTVTSTTIRSPDANSTTTKTLTEMIYIDLDPSSDEHSDCALVTSTTNIEPPSNPTPKASEKMQKQQQPQTSVELSSSLNPTQRQDFSLTTQSKNKTLPLKHHHHPQTQKGILIYTPQNRSLVPADSFSTDGGYFKITKEHLSSIIGEKVTEKFLKYYIGRRCFNSNSTIYFKPPSSTEVLDTSNSESNSDDEFSNFGQYGELYESLNKKR